jgi:hypothetical protein
MTTRPPAPDAGRLARAARFPVSPGPGEDPFEAQCARLASFWALVLRRFRAYAHRSGAVTADRDDLEEGR